MTAAPCSENPTQQTPQKKVYISLTTIPPRTRDPMFLEHLRFLGKQTIPIEKIFVCLARSYLRFPDESISETILAAIQEIPNIEILWMEKDEGPSCKFLGPLIYRQEEIQDNILVVMDDDRFYHPRMAELYQNFFQSNQEVEVASGNQKIYFHNMFYFHLKDSFLDIRESESRYVAAFMSFALCWRGPSSPLNRLVEYTRAILNLYPKSFFHDEGILLNYFRFQNIRVFYLNFRFINYVQQEMNSALCTSGLVNRDEVENTIQNLTNQHCILGKHYEYVPPLWRQKRPTIRNRELHLFS